MYDVIKKYPYLTKSLRKLNKKDCKKLWLT